MTRSDPLLKRIWRFLPRYLYGALCSAYLFSFGAYRNRLLIYRICEHFGLMEPVWVERAPEMLPDVSISSVVSDEWAIKVLEERQSGNISLLETSILSKLVKQCEPERIFEIGTFDGRTTWHMAVNSGDNARVFTLDLPADRAAKTAFDVCETERRYIEKPEPGARFKGTPYEKKIAQLLGDSASFDFSAYEATMDFVFVDGSHAHQYVLNDSRVALKLINRRGMILWHDYGRWNGVTTALNELYASDARFRSLRRIQGTTFAFLTIAQR